MRTKFKLFGVVVALLALVSANSVAGLLTAAGPRLVLKSFSTSFPAIENPISQSNIWDGGGTLGLDWKDEKTISGGIATGTGFNFTTSQYDDCIALLKSSYLSFGKRQYVKVISYLASGYTPASYQEVEAHVRGTMAAHSLKTIETVHGTNGSGQGYLQVTGWNVTVGTLVNFYDSGMGGVSPVADGDVLEVYIDEHDIMNVYLNGVQKVTNLDVSSFGASTGQPGFATWAVSGNTINSMGIKFFQAREW